MASSSRSAKLLSILKKGATVTYLSQKSSWGKIKTPPALQAGLPIVVYPLQSQQGPATQTP